MTITSDSLCKTGSDIHFCLRYSIDEGRRIKVSSESSLGPSDQKDEGGGLVTTACTQPGFPRKKGSVSQSCSSERGLIYMGILARAQLMN